MTINRILIATENSPSTLSKPSFLQGTKVFNEIARFRTFEP